MDLSLYASPADIVAYNAQTGRNIEILDRQVNSIILPRIAAGTSQFDKGAWKAFKTDFSLWNQAHDNAYIQRFFGALSGIIDESKDFARRYNAWREIISRECGGTDASEMAIDSGLIHEAEQGAARLGSSVVNAAESASENTGKILVALGVVGAVLIGLKFAK